MASVSVRYIVSDAEKAAAFYSDHLGFKVAMKPAPGFVILTRGELRLLLSAPGVGGAGQAMPDGKVPEPGGWNRIQLQVDNLDAMVDTLHRAGARFRNDVVVGRGGKQILVEDPAGNCIELFQPNG